MIRVIDSFLHFLRDNLPTSTKIHALRRDPDNRAADAISLDNVNVSFLNLTAGNETAFCSQQVSIDVTFSDENAAVDQVGALFDLLRASFFAPLFDYSDPAHPVATGTNLIWDRKRITFKRLPAEAYCHYNCLLSLKFTSQ